MVMKNESIEEEIKATTGAARRPFNSIKNTYLVKKRDTETTKKSSNTDPYLWI